MQKGAGLYSTGHVVISNCIIEDCTSLGPGSGIFHTGDGMLLKLTNCTFRNNDSPQILNEGNSEMIISNTNRLETNE